MACYLPENTRERRDLAGFSLIRRARSEETSLTSRYKSIRARPQLANGTAARDRRLRPN